MRVIEPLTTKPPADPLRILVADDNAVLRVAVRGLLVRLGHSVTVVSNGREAVEAAALEGFDLVLLDFQMPEMDGIEAARLLRLRTGRGRPPRIVGISGEAQDRESYVTAGMDDFVIKPVRLDDLVQLLNDLVPS